MPDPEWQFVVRACAPAIPAPDPRAVRNWGRVKSIALEQRVYPHVFAYAAHLLPTEVRAELRTQVTHNTQAALANAARTAVVTRLLRDAGVETIVLKGPVLALRLYGDLAARVAGDVDLLVREPQLAQAAQTLANAGYLHDSPITADALRRLRKSEHDVAFWHPADKIRVEPHADIAQPHYAYRADLDRWWASRQETVIGATTVSVLSPEHAYLFSALHAAKHRWHRLDLVTDLAAYGRIELDRDQIRQEAAAAWLLTVVETGEAMVASVFGGGRPGSVRVRRAITQMIAGEEFGRLTGAWFDIGLRERWRDGAYYLWKRLISAMPGKRQPRQPGP